MLRYILIIASIITLTLTSCRNDFNFETSTGELRFSRDTVYLDTVFTNTSSSTYTLKVYNKSNKNISIPSLQLEKGEASNYRLMVDGMPGKVFQNVELLAKDSLFVFIEVTSDVAQANPTDFLYTDRILFGTGVATQKVELVTLIQDAYFIYPKRTQNPDNSYTYEGINLGVDEEGNPITIYGMELDENDPINGNELVWNNTKPYVVYGYAVVPPTKTLTVEAGARIHFHAESGLIVANNASLVVNGEPSQTEALENEVIFEGDRLETEYSEVPGQWGTVWLTQGSHSNSLKNLTLKNAVIGLYVNGNDGSNTTTTTLDNVQIYNCTNYGIYATTGFMTGQNVVVNNCGQASFAGSFGGSYDFTHCTFANYWAKPNQNSVQLDDYDGSATYELVQANFKNCIIYGSTNFGLKLNQVNTSFNYQFENCLIKFADFSNQFTNDPLYDFDDSNHYLNCLIATNNSINNPDFKDADNNELIIGEDSAAKGAANFNYSSGTFDILNNSRTNPSDIGAYNFIIFE
ncbi:hypothetical protein ACFS5J_04550 [Flavobacterium chuncheonense]|uniref:Lipoprotein n=1 Tax=Flavobacterium chuncheonense TaxID=2026653 RepID=A0ABW5YLD0_9FLAO